MTNQKKYDKNDALAKRNAAQSIRNNLDCAKGNNARKVKWYISELKRYTSITEQGIIVMLLMSGLNDKRSIFSQYMPELNKRWLDIEETGPKPHK